MAAEQSWYVAERAEALAALYLTRRKDLEVLPVGRYERNYPFDLLVKVKGIGNLKDASFGIEVKGIRKESRGAKGLFRVSYNYREMMDTEIPVCIFLFAVDDEQGYYRWLHEPVISPDGKAHLKLRFDIPSDGMQQRSNFVLRSHFAPLSDDAVDVIVEQIVRWHQINDRQRSFKVE